MNEYDKQFRGQLAFIYPRGPGCCEWPLKTQPLHVSLEGVTGDPPERACSDDVLLQLILYYWFLQI